MTRSSLDIGRMLADALASGRTFLSESDGLALLAELGVECPHHVVLDGPDSVDSINLGEFPGDRVVLKIMSPQIAHKSDRGGVMIVDKAPAAIRNAVATLYGLFAHETVDGVLLAEFVRHDASFGNEFLVGLRWTEEFGPILAVGPGGLHAELVAQSFRPDQGTVIIRAHQMAENTAVTSAINRSTMVRLATEPMRGQEPRLEKSALRRGLHRIGEARRWLPSPIQELEINPLVVSKGNLVALDVLVRLGKPRSRSEGSARPLRKIRTLLEPRSIAVAGVSATSRNPGRVIVQNVLGRGFDPSRLYIVKPGATEPIEGCPCYPDFSALPEPVDLAVLAFDASQIPDALDEIVAQKQAQSLIVIPGGLEEKPGAESIVNRIQRTLQRARETEDGGPVVNGGNCLGIRSHPGKYDTLFIPAEKMPASRLEPAPVALICQSGAHLVATLDRLGHLDPRYAVSVGNQTDLTIGDYLTALADDHEVRIFAVYVEGFRPLDGQIFLNAVTKIRRRGGHVVVYRAGRTKAGAQASASHTASVAGEYAVLRSLAIQAGAIVAESLDDLSDLITLYTAFDGRMPKGSRLSAMSNAGFECVTIADHLGPMTLAELSPETQQSMQRLLDENRLAGIVGVHHPWDVTPMMGDEAFTRAAEVLLDDANVDLGMIGCVPLTPALQTQEPEDGWSDDMEGRSDIVARLLRLWAASEKPFVVVVEGGEGYDPMARALQGGGLPTFRSVDRAMHALQMLLSQR